MQGSASKLSENIALWGPTGSGKTWLLHALNRELMWYNQNDPEFDYHLIDRAGDLLPFLAPTIHTLGPTSSFQDRLWRFQRRPKVGREASAAHQISTYTHDIDVHDNSGVKLVDAVNNPRQHGLTTATLKNAVGVIALLDFTLLQTSPTGQSQFLSQGARTELSKGEYSQLVQRLCEMIILASNTTPTRYLSICITKIDQLKVRRPPESLVEPLFGQQMGYVLRQYQHALQIRFFVTSSVGYYRPHRQRTANYDRANGSLIAPDEWEPYNVAAPFFWIFECIERARLSQERFKQSRLDDYIKYPEPRR